MSRRRWSRFTTFFFSVASSSAILSSVMSSSVNSQFSSIDGNSEPGSSPAFFSPPSSPSSAASAARSCSRSFFFFFCAAAASFACFSCQPAPVEVITKSLSSSSFVCSSTSSRVSASSSAVSASAMSSWFTLRAAVKVFFASSFFCFFSAFNRALSAFSSFVRFFFLPAPSSRASASSSCPPSMGIIRFVMSGSTPPPIAVDASCSGIASPIFGGSMPPVWDSMWAWICCRSSASS
mmetsp:Transcript_4258/g.10358  ORF Transcript_4258/g.10358 Transcript_4258/m.10358 type:complete len:236 (+) Transcript_4258:4872-5579(+)